MRKQPYKVIWRVDDLRYQDQYAAHLTYDQVCRLADLRVGFYRKQHPNARISYDVV